MAILLFTTNKKQAGKRFMEMSKEKMFKTFSPNVSKFIYNAGDFFQYSDEPSKLEESETLQNLLYASNVENKEKIWKSFLKIYPSLCTTNDLAKVFVALNYFYKYSKTLKTVKIELDDPSTVMEEISKNTVTLENIVVPNEMKKNVASAMKKFANAIKKVKKEKWKDAIEYIQEYLKIGYKGPYSDMTSEEAMRARTEALRITEELKQSERFQDKKKKHEAVAQNEDISEVPQENVSVSQPPPKRKPLNRADVARNLAKRTAARVSIMRKNFGIPKKTDSEDETSTTLEPPRPFDPPKVNKRVKKIRK